MEKLVVLLALLASGSGERQDLSGKVFTFPEESAVSYVKLFPEKDGPYNDVTVCLRYATDLQRNYALFSLSTREHDNGFLIFKNPSGQYNVWRAGKELTLKHMAEEKELLPWTHVCATWDSVTGIAQLWVNGKGSVRKGVKTSGSIQAKPFILLGQEQDSYGGSFDKGQSFVGQISNVHMWDRVLSPCEIWTIYTGRTSEPSNVLSWKSMQFEIEGYVILENEIVQDLCMSPRNNPHDQIKNIQYGL